MLLILGGEGMALLLLLTWLQVRCRTLRTSSAQGWFTEDACGLLESRGWTARERGGGDGKGPLVLREVMAGPHLSAQKNVWPINLPNVPNKGLDVLSCRIVL